MRKPAVYQSLPLFLVSIGTILVVAIMLMVNQAAAKPDLNLNQSTAPVLFPYQGTLMDSQGNPLTAVIDITFRIYDSPAATNPLWEEVREDENAVPVQNGLFNVILGSLIPIPSFISDYAQLFLGVQIGSDAEMTPRSEIVGNFLSGGSNNSNLPVGSVISWWRPNANTPLPSDEWMIADGSIVNDASSPFYGSTLPDLRNKFVMGVASDGIGQTGGANSINLSHQHQVESHTHSIPEHAHSDGSLYANVSLEHGLVYVKRFGSGYSATHSTTTSNTTRENTHITDNSTDVGGLTGSWSGTSGASSPYTTYNLSTATENRPAYVGLLFLIKIK